MRPHPRLTKVAKWGAVALTVALATGWIGSMRWTALWIGQSGVWVAARQGEFLGGRIVARRRGDCLGLRVAAGENGGSNSQLIDWARFLSPHSTRVPAWLPFGGAVSIAVMGWRRDTLVRRRARPGHCSCGYDLTGIPPGQPCPECGCVQKG